MASVLRVVFVRSGCAVILGAVAGLIGLVTLAVRDAHVGYPRSPSSIIWAAVGGAFGFVVGACIGNRNLRGRRAWLIAGLITGILSGALLGWCWARAELAIVRRQILNTGVSQHFIEAGQGLSTSEYDAIGLQYGICLGVLAGTTGGWFWKRPVRLSSLANLFPAIVSCFVAVGAITMNTGFRDLAAHDVQRARLAWAEEHQVGGANAPGGPFEKIFTKSSKN